MTGLLVSVRNAEEAALALAGGADIVDVKEPNAGSLGAADPRTWLEVGQVLRKQVPLSVALGELSEPASLELAASAHHVEFAKVGLAGCATMNDWRQHWSRLLAALPATVTPVAVAYADHDRAAAPSPRDVLQHGETLGCQLLLLDTYDKTSGHLFNVLTQHEVDSLATDARERGLRVVIGGSLTQELFPLALELQPDFIAVRGAACVGERTSAVDQHRVRQLVDALSTTTAQAAASRA